MKATRVPHGNRPRRPRSIAALLLGLVAAVSLGGCSAISQAAGTPCPSDGLRLGVEPGAGDPAALETAYEALGDALAEELDCSVGIRLFDSSGDAVEAMAAGELDVAQFSALTYAVASERVAVTPVATFGMPNGNLSAYTVGIWVAADSGLQSRSQLAGRTLALGAKGTAAGDVLPRSALAEAGLAARDVRISYTGGHDAALAALRDGEADAAEVDSRALAAAVADDSFDQDAYRPVWESGVIPNDPFVLAPDLSEELAGAVEEALLGIAPEAIEGAAAQAGVDAGGRLVGVDEITYAEVTALVEALGVDDGDL